MNDSETSWEFLLKKINNSLHEERSLLTGKINEKVDQLRSFQKSLYTLKDSHANLIKSREERIGLLERKLGAESKRSAGLQVTLQGTQEELRLAIIKREQLERENESLRHDIREKVQEINQLRMELLPGTGRSFPGQQGRKLEKLSDSLKETKDFYRTMSQKIDRMLKH